MAGERYYLITPSGDIPLDGTLRPQQLAPTAVSRNLVRARGHTRIYDLSDGLPEPAATVLVGTLNAENDDDKRLKLQELRAAVAACTGIRREYQEGEKKDVDIEVRYEMTEQDTGKSIKITFRPIEVAIECETPNLTQVRMPEGWQTPFFTGPSYELKFRGWHVPPLQIAGLSGGIQYAAGSTVTWDKSEYTTTVTTGTWGAK